MSIRLLSSIYYIWTSLNQTFIIFAGYEEIYTISQLSPKSVSYDQIPEGVVLQTSSIDNPAFSIEPSVLNEEVPIVEDIIRQEEDEKHHIVARSANPIVRELRSINIDEIPSSNNEIDNELELHNKRKYYDIHPTKTIDYLHSNDEVILSSEGFGDRLEFRFPGEGKRVPYGRALMPSGPRIRPTAVQPIFATANLRNEGRQNSEIQNIITGLVKLLNGNVNVHANTQLLRPGRPMASRINNRGPPRISDVPPLLDFENPLNLPHGMHPTKTPPPYPFERPPVHVNLPEQIVPPLPPPINTRPAIYRPMPPWQRPRPRPPNRRPNPGLPMYKPNLPILPDFPDVSEEESPEEVTVNETETAHSENTIHHEEETVPTPEVSTVQDEEKDTKETITETTSTSTTTTTTTTSEATTTESTTTSTTTENPTTTTTEKPKTEKPLKPEKDKKKETPVIEKDKGKDKHKTTQKNEDNIVPTTTSKVPTRTPEINVITEVKPPEIKTQIHKQPEKTIDQTVPKNETTVEVIQSSITEPLPTITSELVSPTPTEGLILHAPTVAESSSVEIETSSINSQPLPSKYLLF